MEIRKLLDDASTDNVTMALSENKVRISFEDITLTSKLIDGTFPDYERVIPTDNDKILEVNVKELAAAVDRVSVVTERSRGIRMITCLLYTSYSNSSGSYIPARVPDRTSNNLSDSGLSGL